MGASVSKGASRRASANDKATLKVKLLRDTVKTYLRKLEQSLQYEQDLAVQLIQRGLRERAKCIVRKQLVLKEHLRMTDRQLESLESTINALETSSLSAKVFEGLKSGNLALQRANEVLNIKNVELILEETLQAIEKQEEINKMVKDLGLYRSEELVDSDLNHELENLIEKSGSAVVVSTSSDTSRDKFLDKKESSTAQQKPLKGNSWKSLFLRKTGRTTDTESYCSDDNKKTLVRTDNNRLSSLDITRTPKPSTSTPLEKNTNKKKKKKSTPPAPFKPKERGVSGFCTFGTPNSYQRNDSVGQSGIVNYICNTFPACLISLRVVPVPTYMLFSNLNVPTFSDNHSELNFGHGVSRAG